MNGSLRKKLSIATLLVSGFGLIVFFQNFSVPGRNPITNRNGSFDIRDWAPRKPAGYFDQKHVFSAPDGGSSAESVGMKWLERESRPLLEPLEKQWLTAVNGRINRFFRFEPVKGEDWPEPDDDESGGSPERDPDSDSDAPAGMPKIRTLPDGSPDPNSFKDLFSSRSFMPRGVRLTKANEVTLGFDHGTDFACEIQNGRSTFKLSRPISGNSSINLSHESNENKNSMHFNLSW